MIKRVTITQGDNGWVLEYDENLKSHKILCPKWNDLTKSLDEYFGWYDFEGKLRKSPR